MYFYQIKCCYYTENGCMNKKILQRYFRHKYLIDSANSYVPRLYHKQNVEL